MLSVLAHIGRAIWFRKYSPQNLVMALTAYFDDSGTDVQNSSLIVAGFAADIEQWEKFSEEWEAVRLEFGAPRFKGKEFDSARRGFGPYKDWPKSKLEDYFNRLLGIILRRTFKSFSTTLEKAAYDAVIKPNEDLRAYFYSPFAFSGFNGIHQVSLWRDASYSKEPILFVFHRGSKNEGQLITVAKRALVGSDRMIQGVESGDDETLPPLQAADLLAFELCSEARSIAAQTRPYSRYGLQRLDEHPHEWLRIDAPVLVTRIAELIEDGDLLFRGGV